MRPAPLAAAALLLAAGCILRNPGLPPAERGRRLAERAGCYSCHGAEGSRGTANPGRADRTVPNFRDDVMMFAETDAELREWIRDGVSRKKRASRTWQQEKERGALRMPAFRDRLDAARIDELVAFIDASCGRPEPEDSLALAGLSRAHALGCDGCHGPGGRYARPNPGSLRGFIPSWDGPDFAELVRGREEFDQWVRRGIPRRLEGNPLAKHFLGRAPVKMPAFERQLAGGDLDALWAYVGWLRGPAGGREPR